MSKQQNAINGTACELAADFYFGWLLSRNTPVDSHLDLLDSLGAHIGGGEL